MTVLPSRSLCGWQEGPEQAEDRRGLGDKQGFLEVVEKKQNRNTCADNTLA